VPDETLDPAPPFIWPDPCVLSGSHIYASAVPYEPMIRRATALAGIVSGVDREGARWLAELVTARGLRSRLIVVLYPACSTGSEVLRALGELQSIVPKPSGRALDPPLVELRLLPFAEPAVSFPNSLCVLDSDADEPCLITGSSANFGLGGYESAQLNMAFHPEPSLLETWRNWFEWVWSASVPLTHETIEIPFLVPAPGTVEAAEAWHAYLTRCREARARGDGDSPTTDPDSGQVTVIDADGASRPSPGDDLGLPRLDPLAGKVARIFRLGALASVDKTSRTPPLDVPVKAELFGIPSSRRAGVGTRRVEYRFSVLDDRELRGLETKRRAAGELLSRFSFSLADGVRWMPNQARPLFEAELHRVNKAGQDVLTRLLAGDVSAFVKNRRDRVATAAQALYEEHHPGQRVSDSTISDILANCEKRLNNAREGRLLPSIAYTPVQFIVARASEWASQWGQAASLLQAIAEFPRKLIADRLFLRGLDVDENEMLKAMDVCSDAFLKLSSRRDSRPRALEELQILARLAGSRMEARGRCELLLRVIDGAKAEEISADIPGEE
jgi:hypothetical protein